MTKAKNAPKEKRYIFGVHDNPLEDSESDNEWMRHIDKTQLWHGLGINTKHYTDDSELKPETNISQLMSKQRRITCCHNTSGLTHKQSSISCCEVSIVIVILVVAGLVILLPLLLWRK